MSADLAKIRNWNREQQAQRIAELEAEVSANLQERVRMQAVINAFENGDRVSKYAPDTPEIAALREDAERYRWLRDQHQGVATKVDAEWHEYTEPTEYAWMVFRPTAEYQSEPVGCIPGELDAAIDAARGVK